MNIRRTLNQIAYNPFTCFFILFACHFIVLLAFYPGICYYDMNAQIQQYSTSNFSASHPLWHTLFLGIMGSVFKNPNLGFFFASIIQLVVVDGAISYSLSHARSIYKHPFVYTISILFLAIFPANAMLAISHTKDIFFAAFSLILFTDLKRILDGLFENCDPLTRIFLYIRIIVNTIMVILSRNNAVYALLLCVTVLVVFYFFSSKKKAFNKLSSPILSIMFIFVISIILGIGINKAMIKTLDAYPGSNKEMMSIPCQILARVYTTNASDTEKELIGYYIEDPSIYNYYISDPIKAQLTSDTFDSKCKHMLLDTAIISLHHPIIALQAVWFNVQGYFDLLNCPYSSDHFYLAPLEYRGGATLDSKLPKLYELYRSYFFVTETYAGTTKAILFNPAIYIWITLIAFIYSLFKKKGKLSICLIFPITYFLTLLLGPAAIMRYAYIYVLLAPVIILSILEYHAD